MSYPLWNLAYIPQVRLELFKEMEATFSARWAAAANEVAIAAQKALLAKAQEEAQVRHRCPCLKILFEEGAVLKTFVEM